VVVTVREFLNQALATRRAVYMASAGLPGGMKYLLGVWEGVLEDSGRCLSGPWRIHPDYIRLYLPHDLTFWRIRGGRRSTQVPRRGVTAKARVCSRVFCTLYQLVLAGPVWVSAGCRPMYVYHAKPLPRAVIFLQNRFRSQKKCSFHLPAARWAV